MCTARTFMFESRITATRSDVHSEDVYVRVADHCDEE